MKLHVPIRLRWSDLDAYGHVNNVEMLRLLEEARILAFWANDDQDSATGAIGASTAVLDGRLGSATLTLIGRQEIEYLSPVPYLRAPLDVRLWLGTIGGASLDVCYEVWSPTGVEPATLFARATTGIVLVDSETGRPRRISAHERDVWTPYLEDPVVFARR